VYKTSARAQVGRLYIGDKLNQDFSQLGALVDEFLESLILEDEKLKPPRPTSPPSKRREKRIAPAEGRTMMDNGRRKRVKWSDGEDRVLVLNKKNGASWATISTLLGLRSNVDCKDRWINLEKKFRSVDAIYKFYCR
jgi:hypothetical protein